MLTGISENDWNDWRWQLANRVTRPGDLSRRLPWLTPIEGMEAAAGQSPMAVTPYYLSLAREDAGTADPILRMALPSGAELSTAPGSSRDFTAEDEESPVPGLIHRYPDRALLLTARTCPVLCRFCMRRRLFGEPPSAGDDRLLEGWVDYLKRHPEIREVILSGGDPLVLETERLERILGAVNALPHVELLRIGTRAPVTLPMRVDDEFCRMIERFHPLWLVTHFNHPRELTAEAAAAVDRLLRAGVPVENQAVLLRGVNDNRQVLEALLRGLVRIRVRPLYLHQCDPVAGIEHFRTPLRLGPSLLEELQPRLGGTSLPRFMVDLPDGRGKVPLGRPYHGESREGRMSLRDPTGRPVDYPEDPRR
jgi:lysine 2,3-aminomutase